jgi:hypothetical protein
MTPNDIYDDKIPDVEDFGDVTNASGKGKKGDVSSPFHIHKC